jgi:hypothetical protein
VLRLFNAVFRNILFFSLAFTIQACSSDQLTSAIYSKDGLSFKLPATWDVIDDFRVSEYVRTLLVLSDSGEMLTLDIYPRESNSNLLIPPFGEYFKRIVFAKTPTKKAQDLAKITYGTVDRSSGEGLYAELIVPEPDPLHVFIETMRAEYKDFVVYFTFSSQSPSLRYGNKVDLIIEGFEIKKVSSYSVHLNQEK